MSLIVEASRRQHTADDPDEAAARAHERAIQRERTSQRVTTTIVCLVLLAGGIGWRLYLDHQASRSANVTASADKPPAAPTPARAPDILPVDATRTRSDDEPANVDSSSWYQPIDPPPPPPPQRKPVRLDSAPDAVRLELLQFRYSSHLYSSLPAARSLSVNARRLHEGDAVGDWALAEITERGAIWDNGDIMVDVPVLDLWE